MGRQIANGPRALFRRHRHRFTKAVLVNGALTFIGYALLVACVFHLEYNPVKVSLALSAPMMVLGFFANWLLVWRDREPELLKSAGVWTAKWASMGTASQASFAVLVGTWGLPYWLVRPAVGAPLSLVSYVINEKIVFPLRRKIKKA